MNPIRHTRSFLIARLILLPMAFIAIWASPPFALDGLVQIHDPSTIIQCDGKFYTYGTGSGFLDLNSTDYRWETEALSARLMEVELCNGIDPGLFVDTDGRLWINFGSYFGYIRMVELDPKTGKRLDDKYANIAFNCEATVMMYRHGWYYLLGTHGSCCHGSIQATTSALAARRK